MGQIATFFVILHRFTNKEILRQSILPIKEIKDRRDYEDRI